MAISVVIAIIGVAYYQANAGISTAVGEQRILVLEDGTRVYLNTDSRIVIRYDRTRRAVDLESGEALFEVAKRSPKWPFIVSAAGRHVTAFGTSFVVRRDDERLAVTLVEGKITVASDANEDTSTLFPESTQLSSRVHVLVPGQRIIYDGKQPPELDKPNLERVTAWRTGHVDLDNEPLVSAVAEMNRYSSTKLAVTSPQAAAILITGIFRPGDSVSFANAVAASYGLEIQRRGDQIFLQAPTSSARK